MEIKGGVDSKIDWNSCIKVHSSKHIPFRIIFIELMCIINWIIEGDILFVIVESSYIRRKDITHQDEAIFCLHLVDCIIESVSVIDTMKKRSLNVSLIIVCKSYFEVVVSFGCYKDVLGVVVRMRSWFNESNSQEDGIVGHMEVFTCQKFMQIDEGSG